MAKTLRSRISAVAVVALGAGLLQAAPAFAASGDLTGKVGVTAAATALDATTVNAGTATTAGAPATFTAIAGSTFKVTLTQDTAAAAVTLASYDTSDFSTTATSSSTWNTGTSCSQATGGTADRVVTCQAPATAGTYYVLFTKSTTNAYLAVTVTRLGAVLGDGLAVAAGTATSATSSSKTVNGVAGPANTVTVQALVNATGGKAGLVTVSGASATIRSGGTVAADSLSTRIGASSLGTQDIVINTPATGTITVSYFAETVAGSGIFGSTAAVTVTVTVNATALTGVFSAAKSTAYANTGATSGDSTSDATYTSIRAAAALNTGTPKATVTVTQKDGFGNNLTAGFKTVTATITGGGLLGLTNSAASGSSVSDSSGAVTNVYVYSNGTVGKATLTVTLDGTTVKTLPITFYGTVASLTVTVKKNQIKPSSTVADVYYIEAKDSAGNLVADTPTVSSATVGVIASGTCAASDPTTTTPTPAKCQLVSGATLGTSALTFKASGDTSVTATATAKVTDSTIRTISAAFDAASYTPGAPITLTVTAKDKNGDFVGDGTYTNVFTAAFTTSAVVSATVQFDNATDVTFKDGVATVKFFAPLAAGDFKVTGTTGAGAPLYSTVQSTSVTASAKVAADTTAIDGVKADVAKAQAAITALSTSLAGIQTAITALVASTTSTLTLLQSQILKIMKKLGLK